MMSPLEKDREGLAVSEVSDAIKSRAVKYTRSFYGDAAKRGGTWYPTVVNEPQTMGTLVVCEKDVCYV